MLSSRQDFSDAGVMPVQIPGGVEATGLRTEDPAQPGAPSAPKRYALPADWEKHQETIRRLYLDENKPLKDVMAIMGRDYGHIGSIKQYKNRLRLWNYDIKYKRHQSKRKRKQKRSGCQSAIPEHSLAAQDNNQHSEAPEAQSAEDCHPETLDAGLVGDDNVRAASAWSADDLHLEGVDTGPVSLDPFQAAVAWSLDDDHFGIPDDWFISNDQNQVTDAIQADGSPIQPAAPGVADTQALVFHNAGAAFEQPLQPIGAGCTLDCSCPVNDGDEADDTHPQAAGAGHDDTSNAACNASTENYEDRQLSLARRHSFALNQAVGVRSGRSATPPISTEERIFLLAGLHVETSFSFGCWKVNSNNSCTSQICTKEDVELPEKYFDLVRSAVLLFQQRSTVEGRHVMSTAFALVKPILESGNVRALNFFWTSVVFLVQFDHANIVVSLIKYIHEMAQSLLHPANPVVKMFKFLTQVDVLHLESLVHQTWQITADAFQKQLPKLHPEYVRHQCDLIFRIYGTRDAETADRRLHQLLKDCQETPQTPELSHMTVLNALGYNFMNSKDWKKAVNIGCQLEKRALLTQDIDHLVYQIGGLEIQARAYSELELVMPAIASLERATPLIAEQWGNDDPWRIELMILQQKWLRENGDIQAADDLKAEIISIAERIDTD